MRNCLKKMLLLLSALSIFPVHAATLAIIDSGTDMLHKDIFNKAWVNPVEIPGNDRDEDHNGYQDDINGWNFAEGNNQLIDYKYLPLLTFDVRKFFEIQGKSLLGTVTDAERAWMRAKFEDQEFVKNLQTYGNFMHGTHVAGISARDADEAKVLAVKLIPTEVKLPIPTPDADEDDSNLDGGDLGIGLLKAGLTQLAKQQMKLLVEIGEYVGNHKADVANGSFGTGYPQSRMIVEALFKGIMRRDATEEEAHMLAVHFITTLVQEGAHMVAAAPDTLFVFAAGNDGLDNDKFPTSPTNIKASNVLSVAATLNFGELAVFSNYGKKMVDVAAPGVAIKSSVPGNEYLQVSGTSQAAPYVTNLAGRIKDVNKDLGVSEIKKIIMETVDKREELKEKVLSSGIVNTDRALRAAALSLELPLARALSQARVDVGDQAHLKAFSPLANKSAEFVLPLPSGFSF